MINRQRALIRFIANEGGRIKLLRLVKLSFLLRETAEYIPKPNLYDFIPYHYGPYSFTLNHELRAIERDGWVRITESGVELLRSAETEISKLDRTFAGEIDSLTRRYRNVGTTTLVSRVYAEYPWYTSKAKDEKLRGAAVPTALPAVFTVGYEGMMLDGLLDLLLRTGVNRLIDVRCNPVARRFGFHKNTIERHCRDVAIQYTHVPELGIPSSKRANLDDKKSYNRLFDYYEEKILPAHQESVNMVSSLVRREPSALMCMEADAKCCHRTRLAAAVAKETDLPARELTSL
ncbi:MAG: DUF488 domain-containing protein [Terracidiphilus sp.]